MNEVVPYQNKPVQGENDFTLKEKVVYTLLAGVFVGACFHFGKKLIQEKKEDKSNAQSFKDGTAATIAKQIKMTFENDGMFGTDIKRLRYIMSQLKSQEQWGQIAAEYKNQNHDLLEEDLKNELQSSERDEMMAIKDAKPLKIGQKVAGEILYKMWARRFKAGFDKMYGFVAGTDESCILAVLQEIPTQRAFINVGVAYFKEFKRNLMPDFKAEFNTWTYPTYLAMITNKPKA